MTQTLKNVALAGVAALTLGVTAAASVSPAGAQALRGYGYDRGYGPGIAGGAIGLGTAGMAVASSNFGYQNWPYAPNYYPYPSPRPAPYGWGYDY